MLHQKRSKYLQLVIVAATVFLTACRIDYTNYYPDGEDEGLAIFSDNGNNLLTCYVDGKGWRTASRIGGGFSPRTSYEVYIERRTGSGLQDTLLFDWYGYFNGANIQSGYFSLALKVQKNFSYKNFSALNQQRITIDGNTGYFLPSFGSAGNGTGNIYFHTAILDSTGPVTYKGRISGLFNADFSNAKITRGRFDHSIDPMQVRW